VPEGEFPALLIRDRPQILARASLQMWFWQSCLYVPCSSTLASEVNACLCKESGPLSAIKMCGGSGSTDPLFLNFIYYFKMVYRFHAPVALLQHPMGIGMATKPIWTLWRREKICVPRVEPVSSGCPTRRLVVTVNELLRLLKFIKLLIQHKKNHRTYCELVDWKELVLVWIWWCCTDSSTACLGIRQSCG
jgi:hypothetical protein